MTTEVSEGAVAEFAAAHAGVAEALRRVETCAATIRQDDAPSLRLVVQRVEHDPDDVVDRPKLVLWFQIATDVPWETLDELDDRLWDALGTTDRYISIVVERAP